MTREERARKRRDRQFKIRINTMFSNSGFRHLTTRNRNINIAGSRSEVDAVYVLDNLIVISEDTTTKSEHLRDHINKTGNFLKAIDENRDEFIQFLRDDIDPEGKRISHDIHPMDFQFRYMYISINHANLRHFRSYPFLRYLSHANLKYFEALCKCIHRSAKYELLSFLEVELSDLDVRPGMRRNEYEGFVLSEARSGLPANYKVLTFYIDPETLIRIAFVLRKHSWVDVDMLFQRLLIKGKMKSMRKYLAEEKRVFVNNIIVALPEDVSFIGTDGVAISDEELRRGRAVNITLPDRLNSIGIIDGQHRVYAYHEGEDQYEEEIAHKRLEQQLLITGILFPRELPEADRLKLQARLFLEINDKQTRAKGDLTQSIKMIVDPFNPVAIGKSVILSLAEEGPLSGLLEVHYFEPNTIKTTSIVAYGLRHIVEVSNGNSDHSFYNTWRNPSKELLLEENHDVRNEYVKYCAEQLNTFISAFKVKMSNSGWWTTDRKVSRALTTTSINGLVYCMRRLLMKNNLMEFDDYVNGFDNLTIEFTPDIPFHSSRWRMLGDRIYYDCFADAAERAEAEYDENSGMNGA
ncbi:MAG: DGQHR domain-containing protein [Candidatus Aegiribacteria sp.]|nr:DGQHR domain-containing protein [Candidatus Aegiribacteria sp.]